MSSNISIQWLRELDRLGRSVVVLVATWAARAAVVAAAAVLGFGVSPAILVGGEDLGR